MNMKSVEIESLSKVHGFIFLFKVNLGNTYRLAIFIFLGKFLIPSNSPYHKMTHRPKMHIFIKVSLYADDEA